LSEPGFWLDFIKTLEGDFNMRRRILAFLTACLFVNAFPQEEPGKIAIYVHGASDAGISKALGNKMLAAFVQSGRYAEIGNAEAFHRELAKNQGGVAQAAQMHGAEFVCAVNIAEAFGVYSVFARMMETANSRVLKAASADSPLNSFEELARVSDELARQLLQDSPPKPAAVSLAAEAPPLQKQCERTYNINEILFKVKDGFPARLKDCSQKLAKDMLTPASLGGKKLEPKSFMRQCTVDGIKNEIPDGFPNADKVIGSLDNFMQAILNAASAGGGLDPKKLVGAIGSMDIAGLASDVKNLASGECVADEPYEPPPRQENAGGSEAGGGGNGKSFFSLGFRAGMNFSHIYEDYGSYSGSYNSAIGFQGGFAFDFALAEAFHLQPGIMFIKKGAEYGGYSLAQYYAEFPLLVSLKLWALRINAGPYFSFGGGKAYADFDLGLSFGGGFDIGMFYIGAFYDYGLADISRRDYVSTHNRSLVFNLGVNL
jgi:hypothetical protein